MTNEKNDKVRKMRKVESKLVEERLILVCSMIIYRMVIVEGRCTIARSSSLGANCSLVDTKV